MESIIIIIHIVITISILFLLYINYKNLKKLINYKDINQIKNVSEERYYELSSKIQLLYVISTIFISIISFVGYSTKDKIDKDINRYKILYESTIDTINHKMDSSVNIFVTKFNEEINQAKTTNNNLSNLLKEHNIVYKSYVTEYIRVIHMSAMSINKGMGNEIIRSNFKDIRTNELKPLPKFSSPPFLVPNVKGEAELKIVNVTNEYFDYRVVRKVIPNSKTKKEEVTQVEGFSLFIISTTK